MMKQLIVTGLTKTFGQGDNIVHALLDVNLSSLQLGGNLDGL